jgi:hypothetical protein
MYMYVYLELSTIFINMNVMRLVIRVADLNNVKLNKTTEVRR